MLDWHAAYVAWFQAHDEEYDVTGDAGIAESDLEMAFEAGWKARGEQ